MTARLAGMRLRGESIRFGAFMFIAIHAVATASAAPVQSPLAPAESLQHIVVAPDLCVDLVACEPQVIDPVAIRFDEQGRLWVVEMRDYPLGAAGGNPARSRISLLEDGDADGQYETATVFADDLAFATGVQPWKGGVIVTMAGQVAYMKDNDGDNRADQVEVWYTGFAEQNTQLRANDPRLALDNHVYVASGLRGGSIVDPRRPGAAPLSISGMDFRFNPLTGECEAVAGAGQFGMTFDDFGNRFICSNRNPVMHVVLDNRRLQANPLVAVPAVVHDVARAGELSRVFPIAASWTTSNLHAGQFTAACGVEVLRGSALPAEYAGDCFVCEPTGHLVHREQLAAAGATFTSTPAEEGREFLASRDSWFSPVNLEVGPDGALYVVDMYRAVIEHPEWAPPELQHRPDQLLGNDRGRIYRVRAAGASPAAPASHALAAASDAELLACLESDNSWRRDTASRLVLERQGKHLHGPLRTLAQRGSSTAKVHALRLIEGLGLSQSADLRAAMADADPRVVEHAIDLAHRFAGSDDALRGSIRPHLASDDARVRIAARLALAPCTSPPSRPADRWEQQALLVGAGDRGGDLLAAVLADAVALKANVADAKVFVAEVARLAAASPRKDQHDAALTAMFADDEFQRAALASFFSERRRRGVPLESALAGLGESRRRRLDAALSQALAVAQDAEAPEALRCEAIDLAALAEGSATVLTELAAGDASQAVAQRAVAALVPAVSLDPWRKLLAGFGGATPGAQRAILDGLLTRPDRTALLLEEVAAGRLAAGAIDAARGASLLNHRDPAIRQRAEKLFADAVPADRQQVLADYQTVLAMKGDPRQGREVFAKHCATCHKVGDVGVNFAPDISDSREKTIAQLLTSVIQPNRAVDANYFSYTALTADGLGVTGLLTAETSTSVTLKESFEKSATLNRDEIVELVSTGLSLMPEGLERDIPPQHMADLLAFIKNWRYLDESSPPAGR